MLVKTVRFLRNGKNSEDIILSRTKENSGNFFTIINGENGTGKSALLRIISDSALGLESSRQSKLYASEIALEVSGTISRTIALSGTHNDRFPLNTGVELRMNSSRFDLMEFHYFGPKQSGYLASAARAANSITHSLLTEETWSPAGNQNAAYLLEYLGFRPELRIGFSLNSKKMQKDYYNHLDRLRDHVTQIERELPSSSKLSSTIWLSIQSAQRILDDRQLRLRVSKRDALSTSLNLINGRQFLNQSSDFLEFVGVEPMVPPGQWLADLIALGVLTATLEVEWAGGKTAKQDLGELSSGQWQLINTLLNLCLVVKDDTLVLIDEPENSLHPKWQSDFVGLVRKLISHRRGCHVIVATHSPLIAASLLPHEGELIGFKRSEPGKSIEVEREGIAYGWLPGDVLTDIFDMNSSRPPELTKAINKALELLKIDKTSTKELRGIARNVQVLRRSLPNHDPLNPILDAIEAIAFPQEKAS
ncbi:putative ATPase [Sinorhizobium fredii]|uniref:AAA family ATPase n=1 Tax=Rhizobium fredii TaxID=380 RepID=UPI00351218EE